MSSAPNSTFLSSPSLTFLGSSGLQSAFTAIQTQWPLHPSASHSSTPRTVHGRYFTIALQVHNSDWQLITVPGSRAVMKDNNKMA